MGLGKRVFLVVVTEERTRMSSIISLPVFEEKLHELNVLFASKKKDHGYIIDIADRCAGIQEWVYSTGDIFNPLPYRDEMMGFNPGRLVKKKYATPMDAVTNKSIYASGFIDGKRVILKDPVQENTGYISHFFQQDDETILVRRVKYKVPNYNSSQLVALNIIKDIDIGRRIYVGVSERSYSCSLLIYDSSQRLTCETSFSQGWIADVEYHFTYDGDNSLIMVTTPSKDENFEVKLWPKSKDWKVPK
jgi:hypothetical protein